MRRAHVIVPISEHDIELFKQLVDGGDSFSWNFGVEGDNSIANFMTTIEVVFVKQEEEE